MDRREMELKQTWQPANYWGSQLMAWISNHAAVRQGAHGKAKPSVFLPKETISETISKAEIRHKMPEVVLKHIVELHNASIGGQDLRGRGICKQPSRPRFCVSPGPR